MAGGAVGHGLRAGAAGQAMKAVCKSGNAVGGQIVTCGEERVTMAAPAGHQRNARGIYGRLRIGGRQNGVITVAIGADRRVRHAMGRGLSMNASGICFGDSGVAGGTGLRHMPMVDGRAGILRRINGVGRMAVRARGRVVIPGGQSATVHAGFEALDRMRKRNLMLREKPGVGMARTASLRQIFPGRGGHRIVRGQNLVRRAVAGLARRGLRITSFHRLPMHARQEILQFAAVARSA
jgi:hypothetical protein